MKIDLLDHGYIRIVDHMGSDLSIVRSARVSHDADWRAGDDAGSDAKLIRYLWNHHHTTPFESVTATFEVQAPILVFRQWHRHRTQSYNEMSARYTELPELFYLPEPEDVGVQSTRNKQGRETDPALVEQRTREIEFLRDTCVESFARYRYLLEKGWPRELARACLPVNTYSRMFATANLKNLLHFMTLRCDRHAQQEIRVYADAMCSLLRPIVPVTMAAWEANPWGVPPDQMGGAT